MQFENTKDQWGAVAKSFHWLLFVLFVGQLAVGLIMEAMDPSDQKWFFYRTHKAMGIVILGLVIARLIWRLKNIVPAAPRGPQWQLMSAKIVIFLLYVVMFALPVTGLTMSLMSGRAINFFDLFTIPAIGKVPEISGVAHAAHGYLGYIAIAAISLHIGASLYHHFILKDDTLKRMLPSQK